jgi:transposase
MKKTDARKLKPDVQQQLRHQAIRLRKSGRTYPEIAEIVGVHLTTVCRWYKAYEKQGAQAIRMKKRGRKYGTQRTLDADQEKQIKRLIADKAPDQLKLPFALWTRVAVQQLIKRQWAIQMPIRTVGEYLKRWGFTPQKPLRRAYEQSPTAVKKWLDKQYPAIAQRAKAEKGEIHWGDETGLSTDAYYGRSYAPRGRTPALRIAAKRESLSLISTVTNRGKMRFMIYRDAMNAKTLIKFLKRLIKDAGRKVFLILDNLRAHHSKVVKEWLEEHKEKIELFNLPSYSPELNPDEYLNGDLKTGVHSKAPARTRAQLYKKAVSHLRMVQNTPKRVQNYFKHPKVAYAA